MCFLLHAGLVAQAPAITQVNDTDRAEDGQDESFRTPDWAKGMVWYQVFPERFRDGNPLNNPQSWDLTLVDWDQPFAETGIEEIERAWNRARVAPTQFGYQTNRRGGSQPNVVYARRYGGDLQGVYEQLESLKAMGFTGIYLCPVFQSRSLHKYDADDHRHIDPTLGNPASYDDPGPGHTGLGPDEDPFDESSWAWTPADRWFVDVFLPKAKSLGLRVVLDGVWNHVGLDHFAFNHVREHGEDSPYADWFQVVFDDDGRLIGWQGWSRVNGSLPEFKHIGEDLASGPKAHVMAVTRRWMDPNGDGDPSDGIDGWRLDVAAEIGVDFWRDWRAQVKSLNPDALIVAEIWHDAAEMLGGEAFDAQMNYPFAYPVADWLSTGTEDVLGDAGVLAGRLSRVFYHGPEIDLAQYNLMTSHDTERLASMMHNSWPRGYDNESSRWFERYDASRIDATARQRALAAFAVMVGSPGAVMVYNGDEYAIAGADDPDNRRPLQWDAFSAHERRFAEHVGALLRLRQLPHWGEVLRLGSARFEAIEPSTLVIRREHNGRMVVLCVAPSPAELSDAFEAGEGWARAYESERKFGLDQRNSVYQLLLFEQSEAKE